MVRSGRTPISPPPLPTGQKLEIAANEIALAWEQLLGLHQSLDPDAATGAALDKLCAITGTKRDGPSASTAALVATGTPLTVLPSGRLIGVAGSSAQFSTGASKTISAVPAWQAAHSYLLGERFHVGGLRVYQVLAPGVSGGSAPTFTGASISDGGATITYLGQGSGAADLTATATATGPTIAVARTMTTISTPVGGWASVINLADAVLGANRENSTELRTKRERELASGSRTVIAIQANLSRTSGVTYVAVAENTTDATNADGLPPHSVEAIVQGGTDAAIAQVILDTVAEGIATYGTSSSTATDDDGNTVTVYFTRPTEVPFWVETVVEVNSEEFPGDGAVALAEAIVAEWNRVKVAGLNVRSSVHMGAMQRSGVSGYLGIQTVFGTLQLFQDLSPGPSSAENIPISVREIGALDASRVNVTVVGATP